MSPEVAGIIHAHMPPPVLPPTKTERPVAAASANTDSEELTWTPPEGTNGVPIPRPLPHAVLSGVFGTDEQGEPIEPSPEEVLEITKDQGERLGELLESVRRVDQILAGGKCSNRAELLRERERTWSQAKSIVALYAEDFGETAARHFESYAARLNQDEDTDVVNEAEAEEPQSESKQSADNPKVKGRPRPKKRASSGPSKTEKLHEEVDKALVQLAASLEAGQSDTFKKWLTTMSRFHDYSLNNQMLIAFQRPDATRVAGFHAWKKFNRLVNKGEKGIMILAPVTKPVAKVEEKDAQGKTKETTLRKMVNTKVVYVFDISQTHGEPLPEFAKVAGDPGVSLTPLKEFIASKAIEVYFADRLPGGAQGLSQGGRIGCLKGLTPAEEFRTLVHEAAHELLHRGERREQTTRRSRELEAESVAFAVCTAIGLDARASSTDYIHLFRGNKQMLLESMQFIRQVSKEILSALNPTDDSDAFNIRE